MAPTHAPGWAHPYDSPFICYADGDPVPEPAPAADPAPDPEPAPTAWVPPTQEEYEETVAKLQAASGEAANRRKWLKAAGYDPKTGQKLQPDPEPDPEPEPKGDPQQGLTQADVKRQVDRAVAEAKIEGMRGAKKLASSYFKALSDAGWNGTRLDLIMPLSDLDGADPDDPDDMAERVEKVKALFQEGFTPTKRTRSPAVPSNGGGGSGQNGAPPAKVDTADKPVPKPEPKDWAKTLADRALRG